VLAHVTGGAPVALTPDGQTLLAATPAEVTVWSLASPARPARIATIPGLGQAQAIVYAPGRATAAIAYPRAVALWDLANPAAPYRIAAIAATAAPDFQDLIAFSPDGRTLATATARHTVRVWDVATPSAPRYLATVSSPGPVGAPEFSPAAPQLAYLSNGAVTVVDLTHPARQAHAPMPGITPSAGHSYALTYAPDRPSTSVTRCARWSWAAR
jgi:hypothetical protein